MTRATLMACNCASCAARGHRHHRAIMWAVFSGAVLMIALATILTGGC